MAKRKMPPRLGVSMVAALVAWAALGLPPATAGLVVGAPGATGLLGATLEQASASRVRAAQRPTSQER